MEYLSTADPRLNGYGMQRSVVQRVATLHNILCSFLLEKQNSSFRGGDLLPCQRSGSQVVSEELRVLCTHKPHHTTPPQRMGCSISSVETAVEYPLMMYTLGYVHL